MMKRILLIALSIFALASCQKDPVKEQADWTIIFYGNRGNRYTESTRIPTINFLLGADGTFEQLHLEDDGETIGYVDRYHWDGSLTRVYYAGGIPGSEASEGNWGGSGPATYEPIRLNQLTGWCRWLQINQQKPLYLYNLLKK